MKLIEDHIELPIYGQKLFCPFNNAWNQNVYYKDEPFSLSPTFLRANSTSGSPVVLGNSFFIGCLNPHADALFSSDGNTLSCTTSENQVFYYSEGEPYQSWQNYNQYISSGFTKQNNIPTPSITEIEYCTWVEQKKYAALYFNDSSMERTVDVMNDCFIEDYINRIDNMSLPRGVLTLDHGWAVNSADFNFGQAIPDKNKFKNFALTIRRIKDAGFIPGLWFAPAFLYPESELFKKHPELKGEMFCGANEGGFEFPVHYFNISDETAEIACHWFIKIFSPYIDMGVKKLKIDFTYNNKSKMIKILEQLYLAVKSINPEVEIEGHIPDIFAAQYQDAVRLNDLVIESNPQWEQLFEEHYKVCLNSAYQTQLNLDHIGTNSPNVSETDFLKSLSQFKGKTGYPVVSLLPDHFSIKSVEKVREYLTDYQDKNSIKHTELKSKVC